MQLKYKRKHWKKRTNIAPNIDSSGKPGKICLKLLLAPFYASTVLSVLKIWIIVTRQFFTKTICIRLSDRKVLVIVDKSFWQIHENISYNIFIGSAVKKVKSVLVKKSVKFFLIKNFVFLKIVLVLCWITKCLKTYLIQPLLIHYITLRYWKKSKMRKN